MELYHQLLRLLHLSEVILINDVCVVKEQVVLRGQFYLHVLNVVLVIPL